MKRKIYHIVLHCTGTRPRAKVSAILGYWKKALGWMNPGYHFLVNADGWVSQLQPLEKVANGVKGHNRHAIHVGYIGGKRGGEIYHDTRTAEQYTALGGLVKALHGVFPQAKILGHRDFKGVNKACPGFEVAEFLRELKVKSEKLKVES